MSAVVDRMRAFLQRIWPFGAFAGSRWVEPSSEITRMVMAGFERERQEAANHFATGERGDSDEQELHEDVPGAKPSSEGAASGDRRHGSAA